MESNEEHVGPTRRIGPILALARKMFGPEPPKESPPLVVGDPRQIELFRTPIGNYYLPVNVLSDQVVAQMKAGRVFEPEIVEAARPYIRPGSTVLDVGANFGQMTLLFSQFVGEHGHVYSFEADDFVCGILTKNIAANERHNITVICKAVYDRAGDVVYFPEPDFKRFGSYGSYGIDPAARSGRRVETVTIDSLALEAPISFMKIDIQGSDLFALRGAVETVRRHRMPIIFEFEEQFQKEFNTTFADYTAFVESVGYKVEKVINGFNYLIVPV